MLEIVKQIIDFYIKNQKFPKIYDLNIENSSLLNEKLSCFVTFYYKGEIRGSAGNIKEIKDNGINEIIENTITALTKDSRFKPITPNEAYDLKIRIDKINNREMLKDKSIKTIDPTISGIITIKKDYSKMACILPNINPKLLTGEDFIPILKEKLSERSFKEDDYIIYEIKTIVETSY
ncbi:MAG: AMMECR1 domain-containing protein [Candidatus Gracilibacteria bacterium]|nr:AMMECR1 domain-containing protein [Candidatus Gracilibacteria bacterium]